MARITQENLTDLEKLILSIMVHFDHLYFAQLAWLVTQLKNRDKDYIPHETGIPLAIFQNIIARNGGISPEIQETVITMKRTGLLQVEGPHNNRLVGLSAKDYLQVKLSATQAAKDFAEGLSKGWEPEFWNPEKAKLFIANSASNPDVKHLIENVISPLCKDKGFDPIIGNNLRPPHGIDRAIMEQIKTSSGIIVDLTDARPSVYLELGFAMALGMPCMLICCKDHENSNDPIRKVHFDIRQYPIGFWKREGDVLFWDTPGYKPDSRIDEVFGILDSTS
jgi:hypothetical protein